LLTVLDRGQVPERVVRALFVAFDQPPVNGFADVFQTLEQMLVQQFFAKRTLKRST